MTAVLGAARTNTNLVLPVGTRIVIRRGHQALSRHQLSLVWGIHPLGFHRSQQFDHLGPYLLDHALGFTLLRRCKAVGAQHTFAPGEVNAIGQNQKEYKESQHGFRSCFGETVAPGAH